MILGIDPGPAETGLALYHPGLMSVPRKGKVSNRDVIDTVENWAGELSIHMIAIEMIASYGMPVGASIFETCVWIGRFYECLPNVPIRRVTRNQVKNAICFSSRAKDSNIRVALIDRFGGEEKAIGGKKCPTCKGKGWVGVGRPTCGTCNGDKWAVRPGPLYGVSGDVWAALAVCLTAHDIWDEMEKFPA